MKTLTHLRKNCQVQFFTHRGKLGHWGFYQVIKQNISNKEFCKFLGRGGQRSPTPIDDASSIELLIFHPYIYLIQRHCNL